VNTSFAKRLLTMPAKRLLYAACGAAKQRWSISIYRGTWPHRFGPMADVSNPVLTYTDDTDAVALYVADPFMVHIDGPWFMFFEILDARTGKREIGLAPSRDLRLPHRLRRPGSRLRDQRALADDQPGTRACRESDPPAHGTGWNRSRMHHIDPHHVGSGHWIACVDGWGA
jgi:hypothetical protein